MFAGIWVLLFLFLLIILTAKTLSQLLRYYKTKSNKHLFIVLKIWLLPTSVIATLLMLGWLNSLMHVDRAKIVGTYEVDSNFYPGKNADWQKSHFRFQIKKDDTFILFSRLADKSEKQYIGKVTWANEATEKWSVKMLNQHHVIDHHPVLYRERFGFYYVFRSKSFGNMFFRKVE
jgi:hypothetical protein